MAERLLDNGRDHRACQRLLRRHTEEGPSTPLRRKVKRATSDGERGRDDGHCREEDIASRHPLSLSVPYSSLEVRARRLAWPVNESVTPSVKQPTESRPGSCVTRPSRHSSTSGVQHSSPLTVTQTHDARREAPEAPEAYTWTGTGVEITKLKPASRGSEIRDKHQRLRSDSWPEVTLRGITRRASLTSLVHATYRSRLEVEPYDGLKIQKAPLLAGPSKGEPLPLSGHEADEESDGEDSDQATQAKPRGYWARGGSTFLPFSKLFTKPRQGIEELEVGNSFQQLSQSEQEVINRTRRVLKQRLTSANRRRSNKDDKVQLSIFVSPPVDGDHHSSGGEECRSPFFHTSIPIQTADGNHREGNTQAAEDAYMSSRLVTRKGTIPQSVIRRVPGGRRPAGRGLFRRARRQEVTTMMSQVSPVPSDHESRPEHNASQAQGGLLQAILTDAETYAANRESHTSVSNRVRRGRRKVRLQVHIKTERTVSSAEDDEVEGTEARKQVSEQGHPRSPQDPRTMGARVRGRLPPLPPPTRRPSAHTPTHAHTAKEKGKLRQILEICAAKVEESLVLSRRLSSGGVWVCLDTLQRGLMSPTEYRVYQEHLQEEREKEQKEEEEQRREEEEERKRRKASARRNVSPYKR